MHTATVKTRKGAILWSARGNPWDLLHFGRDQLERFLPTHPGATLKVSS